MARDFHITPKVLWQILSGGRVAFTFVGTLLPEDPTWTAALVGAGLTAAYFALRSRETNTMLQQETIQEIVESSQDYFCHRPELEAFIAFHIKQAQSKPLLVTGPKNSGTTLMICNTLARQGLMILIEAIMPPCQQNSHFLNKLGLLKELVTKQVYHSVGQQVRYCSAQVSQAARAQNLNPHIDEVAMLCRCQRTCLRAKNQFHLNKV
eukprot:scaffold110160_cov30-Prasinocladus_malaysianus.AAC.3